MPIADILKQDGIQLINDIRANLGSAGMNSTNETSQSLRIEITTEGPKTKLSLYGRPYFMTVQTGRKPTPGVKPSREMIDRITAWVEGRDIEPEAIWAIATKIQEKGTKLWQDGGRTDIVDPAVKDFGDAAAEHVLNYESMQLIGKLKTMKWQ